MNSAESELSRSLSTDGAIPVEGPSEVPSNIVNVHVPGLVGQRAVALTKSELAVVEAGLPPERLFY